MALIVTGVGSLIHVYSIGYMKDDAELRALLRVPEPVPVLHADAGARPLAAGAVRRLGGRRARVVPADRLLVREIRRTRAAGKKAFITNRDRRRRLPARHVPAVPDVRHARHGPHQRGVRRRAARAGGLGEPRRHPAVHRRDRQVGADPAARLAARRDGRPDAGLGADPRGDDGDRRRLPGRAHVGLYLHAPEASRADRDDRRGDRVLRRDDRGRADRHQEGAGLLDDLAARLHVPRGRASAPTASRSSTSSRTRSSRPACSSAPAA